MKSLVDTEYRLREGQANNALQDIRTAIAHKSWIYRTQTRGRPAYAQKLRAYGDINKLNVVVNQATTVYRDARRAMLALRGADASSSFPELLKDHLRVNTTVVDPNAPGQSKSPGLSWIWHRSNPSNADTEWSREGMDLNHPSFLTNEFSVYRVNWLRARALHKSCFEEINFLKQEVRWTK